MLKAQKMEEKTSDKIEPIEMEGVNLERISLEQKRRSEQLYHQLGLDPIVNKALKEFSSSLSGMDRVLEKMFGPYDIKGRAREVARLTALITYASLNEEYHKEAVELEAQIKSLEGERDKARTNYDNLVQKVTDIVGGDYDELKANYYGLIDKLAKVENLSSQIETLIRTINKEKAQVTQGYESQIADGDSKIEWLDSEKKTFTTELERLKSNYKELRTAITTLAGTIPYDEIRERLGQELYAFLLKDSRVPDTLIDSMRKSIDFKKYLGMAAEKGAEEASKHAKETLRKVIKNKIDTVGIEATLYTQTEILSGSVCHLEGERFLDLLNDVADQRGWRSSPFLELSNVNVRNTHGHNEILPTAHIGKAAVYMAVLTDVNAARGVGAKDGLKSLPFVPKSAVPVELRMVDYVLIGNMYCAGGQKPQDVLDETPRFLPLTDVSIRPQRNNIEVTAPFVAVNKEQISLLEQQEISPASLRLIKGYYRKILELRLGYLN